MHFIAGMPLTREQALDIKGRVARPIGILSSRHGLRSDRDAKNAVRNGHGKE